VKRLARTEAAIRLPCGTIFVGPFHGRALELAADAGYSDAALAKAELGFSNQRGTTFVLAPVTLVLQ